MNPCKGVPAERYALAYVEGSLQESEAARFEEHFFECSVCEAQVLVLQRVSAQLGQHPVEISATRPATSDGMSSKIKAFFLPSPVWGLVAIASLFVVAFIVGHALWHPAAQNQQALSTQSNTPTVSGGQANLPVAGSATRLQQEQTAEATRFRTAQLADLTLPAFVASNLRDDSDNVQFLTGMQSYTAGDCRQAIVTLSLVPATVREARAARFYIGSCQLHLSDYAAATRDLQTVVDAGDSPELESALYVLAQTALAEDDPVAAHQYLLKVLALRGDLEKKARVEDDKVAALLNQIHAAAEKSQPKPSPQ